MIEQQKVMVDGNEAAAYVAYRTNEVIAICQTNPASSIGESADAWAAANQKNIWGRTPLVREMQSAGGSADAVNAALQAGALTTTFTSSQGLLLMIPNMFKIAGERMSTVFHIAARSVATHELSIFGDHSDVMATRSTGWAMLFANSVQEVMDFALIAQTATLRSRVPFLHIFDCFRTSHEVMKITRVSEEIIRGMIDEQLVQAPRGRALTPNKPVMRRSVPHPEVFFQSRERANSIYLDTPGMVEDEMNRFGALTGRHYKLYEYVGDPDAERVIIMMGSGCETAEETITALRAKGEKVGLLKVRLYRPFPVDRFVDALPCSVRSIAVLDRTKEPGSAGEPLYQDVVTALAEVVKAEFRPQIIGVRYGLASKEFTPEMVKSVFDELSKDEPRNHFDVVNGGTCEFIPSHREFTLSNAMQCQ